MNKLTANQLTLFEVSSLRLTKSKRKSKKKRSKTQLKKDRRRWRVTYKLRKRGVEIKTNSREILVSQKPSENPTMRWVDELVSECKFHVQFIIK